MNRTALLGILERVAMTFLMAFAALYAPLVMAWASGGTDWHSVIAMSVLQKAVVAGIAAIMSLFKSVLATQVGDPNSGGLVPLWLLNLLNAINTTPPK